RPEAATQDGEDEMHGVWETSGRCGVGEENLAVARLALPHGAYAAGHVVVLHPAVRTHDGDLGCGGTGRWRPSHSARRAERKVGKANPELAGELPLCRRKAAGALPPLLAESECHDGRLVVGGRVKREQGHGPIPACPVQIRIFGPPVAAVNGKAAQPPLAVPGRPPRTRRAV